MSRVMEFLEDYYPFAIIFVIAMLFVLIIFIPDPTTVTQMPTQVDVNGIQWRIQVVGVIEATSPGRVGYTFCDERRIVISTAAIRPQTTLMHELTHAAVCGGPEVGFGVSNMYFNSKTNDGHEGIYNFTNIWSEMLTRNPQLAAYLGQDLK